MVDMMLVLKALSDETRFELVRLLLKHDFCVGALARQLDISKAAVSQHLQVLRKAGLVKGEKRGYYAHYCVNRELLKDLAENIVELSCQKPEVEVCTTELDGRHNYCEKKGDKVDLI